MKRKKILVKSVKRLANKKGEGPDAKEYARFSLYESREHFCVYPMEIEKDADGKDVTACPIAVGQEIIAIQQEITNQESGAQAIIWAFLTAEDAKVFAKREAERDIDANVENQKLVARGVATRELAKNLTSAGVTSLDEYSG